jgi:hypothetical protein
MTMKELNPNIIRQGDADGSLHFQRPEDYRPGFES